MSDISSFLQNVPADIVKPIEFEFNKIIKHFYLRQLDVSQLMSGRFAEAVFRYLEWKDQGSYTLIGKQLNRSKIYSSVINNPNIDENIRFHLLKCTDVLFDIRNRRDVAHLGSVIDVKEMDSYLVVRISKWVLSEIIRVESGLAEDDIQGIINELCKIDYPFIEIIDEDLLVLSNNLNAKDKLLLPLYALYPEAIDIETLRNSINYKNKARFLSILKGLHNERTIYIKEGVVHLTLKGVERAKNLIDNRK